MYWSFPYWYRVGAPSMPPSPLLQRSLALIKQAVQGERNDELFYDALIGEAPDQSQKDIITSIRNDERKHNQMFRTLYKALTGHEITGVSDEQFVAPKSYIDGIQQALFGELAAVERYREIWKELPAGPARDILFEIILDELKHASKYNYLFTVTKCMDH